MSGFMLLAGKALLAPVLFFLVSYFLEGRPDWVLPLIVLPLSIIAITLEHFWSKKRGN
jgi:hypothetical protein